MTSIMYFKLCNSSMCIHKFFFTLIFFISVHKIMCLSVHYNFKMNYREIVIIEKQCHKYIKTINVIKLHKLSVVTSLF